MEIAGSPRVGMNLTTSKLLCYYPLRNALIVQWIKHRFAVPALQVRLLVRALDTQSPAFCWVFVYWAQGVETQLRYFMSVAKQIIQLGYWTCNVRLLVRAQTRTSSEVRPEPTRAEGVGNGFKFYRTHIEFQTYSNSTGLNFLKSLYGSTAILHV